MGNKRLFEIMQEKEKLYAKADFNDEDGIRLGELEGEFADMDGWNAESDAEIMLNGLGITTEYLSDTLCVDIIVYISFRTEMYYAIFS